MTALESEIVRRLAKGEDPLDICIALECAMSQVSALMGKYGISSSQTAHQQSKKRKIIDQKQYYVTAVLDKKSSQNILNPIPPVTIITGDDGRKYSIQIPPKNGTK